MRKDLLPVCAALAPSTQNTPPKYTGVHALVLLLTLLVAGSFPIAASMMGSIEAAGLSLSGGELMLLRFVLAALLFAPYVLTVFGWRLPSWHQWRVYGVLALPLVVFFSCMFTSLKTTSSLNTGALFTTVPTFTALFAWWLNGERASWARLFGLALGTAGALWVVLRGELQGLLTMDLNEGDWLFLLGCLCLAVYQPLVKRWALGVPVAVMTFWVIVMAAVWLALAMLLPAWLSTMVGANEQAIDLARFLALPASVYWGLLYLSLFTTLLSFFVQQLGALTIGPSRTSAYSLLTPSFVMAISVVLEPALFNWVLMPGAALVFAGLLLLQLESVKR